MSAHTSFTPGVSTDLKPVQQRVTSHDTMKTSSSRRKSPRILGLREVWTELKRIHREKPTL